jgi:hypothetical protein
MQNNLRNSYSIVYASGINFAVSKFINDSQTTIQNKYRGQSAVFVLYELNKFSLLTAPAIRSAPVPHALPNK